MLLGKPCLSSVLGTAANLNVVQSATPFCEYDMLCSPNQHDRLECLAQTHVIRKDAASPVKCLHAGDAIKCELHTLPLVRAQTVAHNRVDNDRLPVAAPVISDPRSDNFMNLSDTDIAVGYGRLLWKPHRT
jgi:hypothetical protein